MTVTLDQQMKTHFSPKRRRHLATRIGVHHRNLCPRLYFFYCWARGFVFCLYCICCRNFFRISNSKPPTVPIIQISSALLQLGFENLGNVSWLSHQEGSSFQVYHTCLVRMFGSQEKRQVLPHYLLFVLSISTKTVRFCWASFIQIYFSFSQISFLDANCTSAWRLRQSHQLCSGHHQSVQKYPSLYFAAMVPTFTNFWHTNYSSQVI